MVSILFDQLLVTPLGKLETIAPDAKDVAYLIETIGELIDTVCLSVPITELSEIELEVGEDVFEPLIFFQLTPL